jgi:hypothetical protein
MSYVPTMSQDIVIQVPVSQVNITVRVEADARLGKAVFHARLLFPGHPELNTPYQPHDESPDDVVFPSHWYASGFQVEVIGYVESGANKSPFAACHGCAGLTESTTFIFRLS